MNIINYMGLQYVLKMYAHNIVYAYTIFSNHIYGEYAFVVA